MAHPYTAGSLGAMASAFGGVPSFDPTGEQKKAALWQMLTAMGSGMLGAGTGNYMGAMADAFGGGNAAFHGSLDRDNAIAQQDYRNRVAADEMGMRRQELQLRQDNFDRQNAWAQADDAIAEEGLVMDDAAAKLERAEKMQFLAANAPQLLQEIGGPLASGIAIDNALARLNDSQVSDTKFDEYERKLQLERQYAKPDKPDNITPDFARVNTEAMKLVNYYTVKVEDDQRNEHKEIRIPGISNPEDLDEALAIATNMVIARDHPEYYAMLETQRALEAADAPQPEAEPAPDNPAPATPAQPQAPRNRLEQMRAEEAASQSYMQALDQLPPEIKARAMQQIEQLPDVNSRLAFAQQLLTQFQAGGFEAAQAALGFR